MRENLMFSGSAVTVTVTVLAKIELITVQCTLKIYEVEIFADRTLLER